MLLTLSRYKNMKTVWDTYSNEVSVEFTISTSLSAQAPSLPIILPRKLELKRYYYWNRIEEILLLNRLKKYAILYLL